MKFNPHKYQEEAIEKIITTPRCGLFLDMGLGKTVITLTAISELMFNRFEISKVLIIAPKRVAEDTWTRESEKWDHTGIFKISKIMGTAKQRLEGLEDNADIYVVNRENVKWLIEECRKRRSWKFDMLVIDELSSFKSSSSQRFRALKSVLPMVKRIVGLTGTPTPNGLMDLWSQMYLLDQGARLGKTIGGYRERYFTPGMRNGYAVFNWNPKPEAQKAIQDKISDICVSMKAADYLQLPERINNTVKVIMNDKEKQIYDDFEKEQLMEFDDKSAVVALSAATVSNKLLQIANGGAYDSNGNVKKFHERKLEALADILEFNQEPVLVFYNFKFDYDNLKEYFRELNPCTLENSEDIRNWNEGKIRLLLAHPASVGHGLNIQAGGHIIVWYGLTWSLESYQQVNARLYRQGQTKNVIIHHLVNEGTVDEDVMKALERKDRGQEALLQALKARRDKYAIGTKN